MYQNISYKILYCLYNLNFYLKTLFLTEIIFLIEI